MKKTFLSIGLDNYSAGVTPLKGCVNDAKAWHSYLTSINFESFVGSPILNRDAKEIKLTPIIQSFVKSLDKNDIGVITYSGHGTLFKDRNKNFIDEAIYAYERKIKAEKLELIIKEMNKDAKLILVIDACHSQDIIDQRYILDARIKYLTYKIAEINYLRNKIYKLDNKDDTTNKLLNRIDKLDDINKDHIEEIINNYPKENIIDLEKNNDIIIENEIIENKIYKIENIRKEFYEDIDLKDLIKKINELENENESMVSYRFYYNENDDIPKPESKNEKSFYFKDINKDYQKQVILLTACEANQKSKEIYFNDIQEIRGVFSYYAIKELQKIDYNNFSYKSFLKKLKEVIPSRHNQTARGKFPGYLENDNLFS